MRSVKLDGEPCTLRDYLDIIKYDRACAPLEHVSAIDLAIEISRLKYTSISGLYKMSVWRSQMSCLSGRSSFSGSQVLRLVSGGKC